MKFSLLSPNSIGKRVQLRKSVDTLEPTIQRMTFLKSDFDNIDSVKAAITEHGFDIGENTIVEKSDRFEVVDTPLSKFETVNEIGGPVEGMIIYGGNLKPKATVAKGEEEADSEEDTEEEDEEDASEEDASAEDANEDPNDEVSTDEPEVVEAAAVVADKSVPKGAPAGSKVLAKPATIADPKEKPLTGPIKKEDKEADPVLARIAKFDSYSAQYGSKGQAATSIRDVIKASDDSSPLGVNELFRATQIALSNTFRKSEDPVAGAQAIFTELSEYGMGLVNVYANAPETGKSALAKSILFSEATLPEPTADAHSQEATPVVKTAAPLDIEAIKKSVREETNKELAEMKLKMEKLEKNASQRQSTPDDVEEITLTKEEDEDGFTDPVDSLQSDLRKRLTPGRR